MDKVQLGVGRRAHDIPSGRFRIGVQDAALTLLVFTSLCCFALVEANGAAFLLRDINVNEVDYAGSDPDDLVEVEGILYFTASDGLEDSLPEELWRSDGTAAGTYLVEKLNPGVRGALRQLTRVDDKLFFTIRDRELWVTQGDALSTRMVFSSPDSDIRSLTGHAGDLYFTARVHPYGRELWRSDGTAEGTGMVADILEGYEDGIASAHGIYSASDRLYFAASTTTPDGETGAELWTSDGTREGTRLVKELRPGRYGSEPADFATIGNKTLFRATLDFGHTLWVTEGTPESTVQLSDVAADSLVSVGDFVFFAGDDDLFGREPWRSDGTPAGTQRIADLNPGPAHSMQHCIPDDSGGCRPDVAVIGDVLYFAASTSAEGAEPWRSDGTEQGTYLVGDIGVGPRRSSPADFVAVGETLFFRGPTGLFASDGTEEGTLTLLAGHNVRNLTAVGDLLLFSAQDIRGEELWRTDGTTEGTGIVRDIRSPPASSYPVPIGSAGPHFLFAASDGTSGRILWSSDGSVEGTQSLQIKPAAGGAGLLLDGVFYFVGQDELHGTELWRTDGTPQGTWLLKDISIGSTGSFPRHFAPFDGALYFSAVQGEEDSQIRHIWRSDGTEAGTVPVLPLPTYLPSLEFEVFDGSLFFVASKSPELWRTDREGEFLDPVQIGPVMSIEGLTAVADQMVFSGTASGIGLELWRTDGTLEGTDLLRDINPSPDPQRTNSSPSAFVRVGPVVFFLANTSSHGPVSLWRTDGSEQGTELVLAVEELDPRFADFTVIGDTLAFTFFHFRGYGRELWSVDAWSSAEVHDLIPGQESSSPTSLVAVDDVLVFTADDLEHGRELWKLDAGEMELVEDIVPGELGSNPSDSTRVGEYVFFAATHPDFGTELWAIPVSDLTGTSPNATCTGDCDSDGKVTVAELVSGIGVALHTTQDGICDAFDSDQGGSITIDEVVAAVRHALFGCRVAAAKRPGPILGS